MEVIENNLVFLDPLGVLRILILDLLGPPWPLLLPIPVPFGNTPTKNTSIYRYINRTFATLTLY